MTSIFTVIQRIRRLPLHHRIAHLRALAGAEKPGSIRRLEIEAVLRKEMLKQINKETAA